MNGWIYEWMDGLMDGSMDMQISGWIIKWRTAKMGWMDRQREKDIEDRQKDKQIDRHIYMDGW